MDIVSVNFADISDTKCIDFRHVAWIDHEASVLKRQVELFETISRMLGADEGSDNRGLTVIWQ